MFTGSPWVAWRWFSLAARRRAGESPRAVPRAWPGWWRASGGCGRSTPPRQESRTTAPARAAGGGEDVDVRWQPPRLVQGAHADEGHRFAGASVVAPQGHPTARTTRNPLSLAAVRGGVGHVRPALQELEAIGLDHGIQRERTAGLALAPGAMAAVHEQRGAGHAIADRGAGAGTFEASVVGHGGAPVMNGGFRARNRFPVRSTASGVPDHRAKGALTSNGLCYKLICTCSNEATRSMQMSSPGSKNWKH
ncbi:hypothetical protein RLIN73S_05092 [Rhodanobacter lindaniclasticus]